MKTRLTRACTNMRGAFRPDEIFRWDYYRIKDNVNPWAATVFNTLLATKFIEEYDGICGEIVKCKAGLALNYGDQFMLSDLNSLMDQMTAPKRQATTVIELSSPIHDDGMEQADPHIHDSSRADVPGNTSVYQDEEFTDDPEVVFNYLPRTSSDLVGHDPNSSRSTVVASRSGYRIANTGPTYAKQRFYLGVRG